MERTTEVSLIATSLNPVMDGESLGYQVQLCLAKLYEQSGFASVSLGAVMNDSDFHCAAEVSEAGTLDLTPRSAPDQIFSTVVRHAAASRDDRTIRVGVLRLCFYGVEERSGDGDRRVFAALGEHSNFSAQTYGVFAAANGASGLHRLASPALSAVHSMLHYLMLQHLLYRMRSTRAGGHARALTPKQRQIVELVVAGCSDKQIAARLGLSPHTVHNVVRRLLSRHAMRKRTQLFELLADA